MAISQAREIDVTTLLGHSSPVVFPLASRVISFAREVDTTILLDRSRPVVFTVSSRVISKSRELDTTNLVERSRPISHSTIVSIILKSREVIIFPLTRENSNSTFPKAREIIFSFTAPVIPVNIIQRVYEGDISLNQLGAFFDIAISNNDLTRDTSLQTSVLLSVFTDRRVLGVEQNSRGWWGDNSFGSGLWTLERSKITEEFLSMISQEFLDALAWMVDDGVIKSINVQAIHYDTNEVRISVKLTLPYYRNNSRFFTFYYNVQNQLLRY